MKTIQWTRGLLWSSDSQVTVNDYNVMLLPDSNPESEEAFLMTSIPGDLGNTVVVPGCLSPTSLSSDAFVIIEDDESQLFA